MRPCGTVIVNETLLFQSVSMSGQRCIIMQAVLDVKVKYFFVFRNTNDLQVDCASPFSFSYLIGS